jgi:hypothetical protein
MRTIHLGSAVTMDFAPQGINAGEDNRIKRLRRG